MAAIHQTIAIVDKSNKVVSTSKQLKNVFKEAKQAYLDRKAEIQAHRARQDYEKSLARGVKAVTIDDDTSSRGSRSHSHRRHSHKHEHRDPSPARRPTHRTHRHASASTVYSEASSHHSSRAEPSPPHTPLGQFNADLAAARSAPTSPQHPPRLSTELVRRRTDNLPLSQPTKSVRPHLRRSMTTDDIDMDLAYGEYHPSSLHGHDDLALSPHTQQELQKQELSSLVTKVKLLLDEANCAQHSVKAIVAHLQKNPDAMAAVALTLAEISNIASKMAPGALAAIKSGAPAVFAMLAAPEFLIAVGVGLGVTIVMFGGYKIIKKIKAAGKDKEPSVDEMIDVGELDRIEHWRRGIANAQFDETQTEVGSVVSGATSVEGEFITPLAARSLGHLPRSPTGSGKEKDKKKKKKQGEKDDKEKKKKRKSSRSEVGSSETGGEGLGSRGKDMGLIRIKKPSPLRRMFSSKDGAS